MIVELQRMTGDGVVRKRRVIYKGFALVSPATGKILQVSSDQNILKKRLEELKKDPKKAHLVTVS